MSDSDLDPLSNNIFTFQNDCTAISARGPNINNSNITGLSFRNNVMTSTMHMPVNLEQQRYGSSNVDQRSMYFRRETSPMSLRSVPDYRLSTFNHSKYQNGMGSQRSTFSGRGGSPMSVRSIDSTASVSAADIVFAFKNVKFNKYDLRIIKDAYSKLIKSKQRKRIEKRRNLKLFLKGTRRRSGEDSGEQGSDSSLSSDDCRSVRTTICKENIPRLRKMRDVSHFNRNVQCSSSHMNDASHFSTNMKENPMFTDCTVNIKQNTLKNMMLVNRSVSNSSTKDKTLPDNQNHSAVNVQNSSVMTQKERFKKGFVLPSQRFNKTIAVEIHVNNNDKKNKKVVENGVIPTKPAVPECVSNQEIINGSLNNNKDTENVERKRTIETEDFNCLNSKRNKLDSSQNIHNLESSESTHKKILNEKDNDFIFAKPKMPIKKGFSKQDLVSEKLLAKSHVPTVAEDIDLNFSKNKKSIDMEDIDDHTQSETHSNEDVSMRPSFIKRKLFTQKLDVAERKNASCDSLGISSPRNIYSESMRERSKARKLVTSQSCLSREIPGEDSHVLDLIHKIVPPDQINVTTVPNKTVPCNNRSNTVDNNNKWDVTAIIASCDNQDISDTYTDEEIFNVNHDKCSEQSVKPVKGVTRLSECNVVVQKMPPQTLDKALKPNKRAQQQNKSVGKETVTKSVTECVKSFWDTDFESDMELNVGPSWKKATIQHNQESILDKRNNNLKDKSNAKAPISKEIVLDKTNNSLGGKQNRSNTKASISKGTILTVRNTHKDSNSLKSHRSPISSYKNGSELNGHISVGQIKEDNNKGGKTKDTGKKEDTAKENIPVKNKKGESGRRANTKQCVSCNRDTPTDSSNSASKSTELVKVQYEDNSDNEMVFTKKSLMNGKSTLKSKDCTNSECKQGKKITTNNVTKIGQKNNVENQRETVNNGRTQPKRKSKDKNLIQCSTQRTIASNNKTPSKTPKSKSAKKSVCNNTSISSISTILTRSRAKLSFNSSQGDYSSLNLSNVSNRSLRLDRRLQKNRN